MAGGELIPHDPMVPQTTDRPRLAMTVPPSPDTGIAKALQELGGVLKWLLKNLCQVLHRAIGEKCPHGPHPEIEHQCLVGGPTFGEIDGIGLIREARRYL